MAKLLCTELHEKIATKCLQFYGGNGFMEDYPMARMYRDVGVGTNRWRFFRDHVRDNSKDNHRRCLIYAGGFILQAKQF
ncbi:MAG: alkylation response protein AidB-like acyl-CoA dehydrogenase [Saprospiraceae bacterium]|jgi:alkylation response protein AidB-like acyl-CoA dehydrogenase